MPAANLSPVVDAERRAWSYWFVDGLPYLTAGILCALLSATFIIAVHYRATHFRIALALILMVYVFLGIVFIRLRQTLVWLKSRITYRRTGYVPPPYFTETDAPPADLVMLNLSGVREKETMTPMLVSEDLRWRAWVLLAILLADPLAGQFIRSHALCFFVGCAGGFLAWLLSRKDPRKSWAVVFGLLFAQIYIFEVPDMRRIEGAFYFLAGVGFVLALAGAIVLARYLRRNPLARA
jgi:hypothetical protein